MPDRASIDYRRLYNACVPVLEQELGPKDDAAIHAIIGFDFGGPPDLLLFHNSSGVSGVFYATSDLLFIEYQPENSLGKYELAICVPMESEWAEHILFRLS